MCDDAELEVALCLLFFPLSWPLSGFLSSQDDCVPMPRAPLQKLLKRESTRVPMGSSAKERANRRLDIAINKFTIYSATNTTSGRTAKEARHVDQG